MSRTKKLILFIAVPVAVLFLVLFVIFPGIPAFLKVKLKYAHIDDTSEAFVLQTVPADFRAVSSRGLSLKVPAEFVQSERGTSFTNADNKVALTITQPGHVDKEILSEYIEDYDPWEGYECGEKDYRRLFEKLGRDYIDPTDSDSRFLQFVRDDLRAKDCLKLRGRALKAYMEAAEIKDSSYESEDCWIFNGDGFTGFVGCGSNVLIPDPYWSVTMYPEGSEEHYFILMRFTSDDTAKQIISSIKLDK